ncbi:S1C family serine protease [Halomarina pelagica]|uniref:S1C family serine protease n=1 Tax=Halomarina pelagica TaxID=2961599 RepID=UPI0020C5ACA6|nr:trypsin-like peptidase domain-containing protein [Halomarina sp. BND7]
MADPPRPSTRRRFLAALGTASSVGLAGCSSVLPGPSGGQDGPSDTNGTNGTNATNRTNGSADVNATGRSVDNPYARVYRGSVEGVVLVQRGGGQGSGFVYDGAGHVVTNAHVVGRASAVNVQFSRDDWRAGRVLGRDRFTDLAVVAVEDSPAYAKPLPMADSMPPIGLEVVALGNPYGLEGAISAGIVSGTNRYLPARTGVSVPAAIQTDAPINPGNSGGPLVALDGRVVAVVYAGGGENIAFGISAPLVRRVVPALIEDGRYRNPYLGVRLAEVGPPTARANDLAEPRGVLVIATFRGSPAAGRLRESDRRVTVRGVPVPVGGDVIVGVDGRPVSSVATLRSYLALETSPGERASLAVLRGGEERTVEVTVGARPSR